jgi:hypothetical protein
MAKKKVSPEELIVSFFTSADLSSATTLFNVVKGLMNTRNAGTTTAAAKAPKGTRGSSKAASAAATTSAAAAPAAVAEQAAA